VWTALLSKELRECALYAGLALLAQTQVLGSGMDLPLIPIISSPRGTEIPFLPYYGETNRETTFVCIAIILAIVMGLHQTVWESWRQTTLFLLHRPMPRRQIFLGKILAGVLLLLLTTALPLLIYCLWAATPGTHASPFYWDMAESWWRDVLMALICYLGAFLAGLRPARWIGSRTWPFIGAFILAIGLHFAAAPSLVIYAGFLLLAAGLLTSILNTARLREFP